MRYESKHAPAVQGGIRGRWGRPFPHGLRRVEAGAVDDVARSFYAAVAERDGPGACGLLAPETRSELEQSEGKACSAAVLDQHVPEAGEIRATSVYGTMAQVRYDQDTVFLARFPSGWKVMAAACSKTSSARYECEVKG